MSLLLDRSRVFSNSALGEGYGGGVFAYDLVVYQSELDGNVSGNVGGGAYCFTLTMTSSVVHGNTAKDGGGLNCPGGNSFIQKSEISGNRATQSTGGLVLGGNLNSEVHIVETTISGNIAHYNSAAILSGSILNSTITLNHARQPGIRVRCLQRSTGRWPAVPRKQHRGGEFLHHRRPIDVGSSTVLSGVHNLIGHSKVRVPPDTLRGRPLLLPLANNGGLTRTHALQAGSPAIDRGSNPLDRLYDERGPGFPREKGAAVDIGAFER